MSSVGGVGGAGRTERTEGPEETTAASGTGTGTGGTARSRRGTAGGPSVRPRSGDGVTSRVSTRVARAAAAADERPVASLGAFGGKDVEVAGNGRLFPKGGRPGDAKAALETMNALALRPSDAPGGPFDKISDKALLEKVAARLQESHTTLSAEPPDDLTRLEWRQGRAAALHLLEAAAVRAKALGDGVLASALGSKLVATALAEPWRQARDFAYESLLSRVEKKELPAGIAGAAKEALYPAKPPYEKWLEDGKIRIQMYIDNDGSLLEDQLQFYKDIGFKVKKQPDESYVATRKGSAGQPPLELVIPKPGGREKPPSLFEKMADPSIDAITYCGHAGYGHRVDDALAKGVGGTGEGKAVILLQCWGHGNVESLERAYPDAQMLSTTAPTSDDIDWVLLEKVFKGFQAKEGWDPIQKATTATLKREMKDDPDYKTNLAQFDKHYFYPTTRSILVTKYDRDGDGTNDEKDHIFNVIYPKRVDAAGGYDPVVQAIPKYALDGTGLNKAVNVVSIVTRYNHLLPADKESKLPWKPELWESGGFFEPAEGDLRAFRFTQDAGTGKVAVALSTKFAHTSQEDLSRMAAYEAGLWMADKAGLAGKEKTSFAVGCLERAIHQEPSWSSSQGMLDEPWAEEILFKKRYGLPDGFTFAQLTKEVGEADPYLPEHFRKVVAIVKDVPGIAEAAGKAPARIGTPIEVPRGTELRIPSETVGREHIERAVRALGVQGSVEAWSPQWLQQNQPNNVVATVKAADGKTFQVGMGLDSQGIVRTAARLELPIGKLGEKAAADYFAAIASTVKVPAKDLQRVYDRERAAGKSIGDAIVGALTEHRRRMPLAPEVDAPPELAELASNGLIAPEEYQKVNHGIVKLFGEYDQRFALQQFATFLSSVESRGGARAIDRAAIEKAYLDKALAPPPGGGRGKAAHALVGALPARLPAGVEWPDITEVILLAPEPERTEFARAYMAKAGMRPQDIVRKIMGEWLQSTEERPRVAGLAAMDAAIARGASAADSIREMARAAKAADPNVGFFIEFPALAQLGLVTQREAEALAREIAVG